MSRQSNARALVALTALFASTLHANNLILLPTFSGNALGNAVVYGGNPLAQTATFSGSTDSFLVLTRAATSAADTKHYVISRSGSNSLIILNSAFQPIGQPFNLGQNISAAAITPDGSRLLVVVGNNLRMYNTATDTEIQFQFIDVGIQPTDIAITQDSKRAFILSGAAQKVTGVNLENNASLGSYPLPGLTANQGFLTMSPNGLLYISAVNRVFEVDPRPTPFDAAARRREFTFANANVGKLAFTPDGQRAIAVNLQAASGQLIFYFFLDFANPQTVSVSQGDQFNGFAFDKVFVAGNSRAYAVTANTSVQARKFYQVSLPDPPPVGTQLSAPVLTEAEFGSLGKIPIVDSVAFTPEYPQASRMFIGAPLNLLQSLAQNTVYAVNMSSNPPNVTQTLTQNFLFGPLQYTRPALTTVDETPGGLVRYNAAQPNLATGGRTLPFGIRVLGASGRPLFNVPVAFSAVTPGVTFEGAATVFTNVDGIAMITAIAPTSAGDFTANASVGSSGLATTFTFTAGTTGGGGGGTGTGGTTGSGQVILYEGDGQVVRGGDFSKRIRVRVLDAAGKPVPNTSVTWAKIQGGEAARFQEGTFAEGPDKVVTITDSNGETSNILTVGLVPLNQSFVTNVLTVSASQGTATFYATSILATTDGGPAPPPDVRILAPTNEPLSLVGKAGQTIPGAIRVSVQASALPQLGARMQYVGLRASTDNLAQNGPVVACDPKPIVLTNEEGVATCDLKLSGKAGTGIVRVNVGEFFDRPLINLRVDPGDPTELRITNGDKQAGDINAVLPAPLTVQLGDGGGNTLPGANIRWEVIQGQATLTNSVTITDSAGRASNTVRLGSLPGIILIRATAVGGSNPSVTFEARVNVTVSGLAKVSGDPQTTFTNTAFPSPLVVQVTDTRQASVPGITVNFGLVSGSATLSAASAVTDSSGRAQITVRAGATPGPITINASIQGISQIVTFNLTSQLPGPVINASDFFNAASNERGSISPGGIYTMVGSGLAADLRGCIDGTQAGSPTGALPTRLANVEVQFGSNLAPLFSVCNINGRESVTMQVPFELSAPGVTAATVRVGAGSSTVNGINIRDYQPGVFETTDAQGRRYAVALRPNGTFVAPDNPARYGEIVRVYITGAGQATPQAFTGVTGVPNQRLALEAVVGLNDTGVRVVSANYAVGMIGVYEIAFEVPQGTATGASRSLGVVLTRPNGQFVFPEQAPTIAIAP